MNSKRLTYWDWKMVDFKTFSRRIFHMILRNKCVFYQRFIWWYVTNVHQDFGKIQNIHIFVICKNHLLIQPHTNTYVSRKSSRTFFNIFGTWSLPAVKNVNCCRWLQNRGPARGVEARRGQRMLSVLPEFPPKWVNLLVTGGETRHEKSIADSDLRDALPWKYSHTYVLLLTALLTIRRSFRGRVWSSFSSIWRFWNGCFSI